MNFRNLRNLALGAAALTAAFATSVQAAPNSETVVFQQVRGPTIKLTYAGTTFLVDPLLGRKDAYPGFEGTLNSDRRWPLVDLPFPVAEVLKADAVIVTHTHLDHWDDAARAALPKGVPIFVQNDADAATIRKDGFADVRVLTENTVFKGTRLHKTGGQHGTDQLMSSPAGPLLGQVMGVVFERPGSATVYVAGDTVWHAKVTEAVTTYQPDVIILNTAYARVTGFDGSIIMGKEDLRRAYDLAPGAKIIGTHMDTVNHAAQTRSDLREYIAASQMDPQRVLVPADGETYRFADGHQTAPTAVAHKAQTSAEENKAIVREFFAAVERQDFEAIASLTHKEFMFYPQLNQPIRGAAAFFESEKPGFAAFKGFKFPVERIVAENDQVAAYIMFDGVQSSPLPGLPNVGARLHNSMLMLLRLSDGKIIEMRPHYDREENRRQLLGKPPEKH